MGIESLTIAPPCEPKFQVIRIENSVGFVAAIHMDGSVEFGPGFTADEAYKEMWLRLAEAIPAVREMLIRGEEILRAEKTFQENQHACAKSDGGEALR